MPAAATPPCHSSQVMGVDVSMDEKRIFSVGWDRTLKVWEESLVP